MMCYPNLKWPSLGALRLHLSVTIILLHIVAITSVESSTDGPQTDGNGTAETRLAVELLRRHKATNGLIRPVLDPSRSVKVNFSVALIQILDFNMKDQRLTTLLWKDHRWFDEFLAWDPDDYGGIAYIQLPSNQVWTPDIILYNNIGKPNVENAINLVQLSSDGSMTWIPKIKYDSACEVDMSNYPFDTQSCELRFASWAYDISRLDVSFSDPSQPISLEEYTVNSVWDIKDVKAEKSQHYYVCCPHPYADLKYTLTLSRKVTFHMRLILVPTFLLSYLILAIFWIPPTRPDRTAMGVSLFSAFLLLFIIVVDSSSPTAHVKLGVYYITVIVMVAAAVFLSVFIINISQCARRFPKCLERVNVAFRCCVHVEKKRDIDDITLHQKRRFRDLTNTENWRVFALILDRIFFIVFLIGIILAQIIFLPGRYSYDIRI